MPVSSQTNMTHAFNRTMKISQIQNSQFAGPATQFQLNNKMYLRSIYPRCIFLWFCLNVSCLTLSNIQCKRKGFFRNKFRGSKYGQNLNCKFKTFGFLDTLKIHLQSNYLTSTTLSLLQTKLAEKESKLIFLCSSLFSFRIKKCDSSEFQGGGPTPHPLQVQRGIARLAPPVYAFV